MNKKFNKFSLLICQEQDEETGSKAQTNKQIISYDQLPKVSHQPSRIVTNHHKFSIIVTNCHQWSRKLLLRCIDSSTILCVCRIEHSRDGRRIGKLIIIQFYGFLVQGFSPVRANTHGKIIYETCLFHNEIFGIQACYCR